MKKKFKVLALYAMLFALRVPVEAQQATKRAPRIGFLHSGSPSNVAKYRDACIQALSGLGYIEGKNINFEYRYAEGRLDPLMSG